MFNIEWYCMTVSMCGIGFVLHGIGWYCMVFYDIWWHCIRILPRGKISFANIFSRTSQLLEQNSKFITGENIGQIADCPDMSFLFVNIRNTKQLSWAINCHIPIKCLEFMKKLFPKYHDIYNCFDLFLQSSDLFLIYSGRSVCKANTVQPAPGKTWNWRSFLCCNIFCNIGKDFAQKR